MDGCEVEVGIGNWFGEVRVVNGFFVVGCIGIGMWLGVEGVMGVWWGEVKFVGLWGGMRGEFVWEVCREG